MRAKACAKSFDSKFVIALFLLMGWATLAFTPAQISGIFEHSSAASSQGTYLAVPGHEADSFGPFDFFKANLSKISFKKISPSSKFLPVLKGFFQAGVCHAGVSVFETSPVLNGFLFLPPNKASP